MENILPMENIMSLRNDMRANDWHVTAFLFDYNGERYAVIFEIFDDRPEKYKYYPVILTFVEKTNPNHKLTVRANRSGFEEGVAKKIHDYFGIDNGKINYGNWIKQFCHKFGKEIPEKLPKKIGKFEKKETVKYLSARENDKENAIYCYCIKENGKSQNGVQKCRTKYNSDKTRLLYPELYERFKNEPRFSFCYTDNPQKGKKDYDLLFDKLENNS